MFYTSKRHSETGAFAWVICNARLRPCIRKRAYESDSGETAKKEEWNTPESDSGENKKIGKNLLAELKKSVL